VSRKAPTNIASLTGLIISAIASGDYASYAVTDRGEVYSWGNNGFGQLGHGNSSTALGTQASPKRIEALQGTIVYKLFGGQRTVFAVSDAGDVFAMGNNDFGMLGTGDTTPRTLPRLIESFIGLNVYQVAAGAYHTLAITGCWDLANPCSGHGSCDAEKGFCACDEGYLGYRCAAECPGGIGNACSLAGDCVVPTGTDPYCLCLKGYGGFDCSRVCPGGANNVCSKHGICNSDGECECDAGYSGADCSDRCPGAQSSPCSSLGTCIGGECECFSGFAGLNCSIECNGGAFNPCSYNGDCNLDGSCTCFQGFRFESCACECPGGAADICFGRGACTPECACECRTGFRGTNCSSDCPGGIDSYLDGFRVMINVCSGHGECDRDGICFCHIGYGGVGCEIPPTDWTMIILLCIASLLSLCLIGYMYIAYMARQRRLSERERKRNARKKLRAGKKKRQEKKKDKGKKKSKINK